MKRLTAYLIAALILMSCGNPQLWRAAVGEPIIPVHGDTSDLELTDYLPSVDLDNIPQPVIEGDGGIGILKVGPVSIPIVPNLPVVQGLTTSGIENGKILLKSDRACEYRVFVQNLLVENAVEDGAIDLKRLPRLKGRSWLRVFASDGNVVMNDLLIPLQNGYPVLDAGQLNRHDPQAQVLYSILVDRFFDGNTSNDAPLNRPDVDPRVDYQGGDLKGITLKIEEGFFDTLGVNTLWISPITQNPEDAWGQYPDPKTKFSGYHGYWPIYNTRIDHRMGTDEELRELLKTAHEHDINVILDYVANHMHINSPTLKEHPDWVTDSLLADGRRNFELWDEARLTTWFDKHIPTLDLEREDICEAMTDTALFWIENYDLDGYRHDACKHIPLNYWRMFTRKMKTRYPNRSLWMIGETYGSNELVSSYVKTGMLNAQFDFGVYHTAAYVLANSGESMKRIAETIEESLAVYGAHHTMGNISGNHDKTRFISMAGGAIDWNEDGKYAGWHRDIGVTADGNPKRELIAYKKALLLEVLNMTIPGVPCIYQGDEYGQPGGNDPDNRRMMRFSGLSTNEQWMRGEVESLIQLRRSSMPLLYGDYKLLYVDDNALVYERNYMGEKVVVGLNNSQEPFAKDGIEIEPYGYVLID